MISPFVTEILFISVFLKSNSNLSSSNALLHDHLLYVLSSKTVTKDYQRIQVDLAFSREEEI